jgi:hypothetical protein
MYSILQTQVCTEQKKGPRASTRLTYNINWKTVKFFLIIEVYLLRS